MPASIVAVFVKEEALGALSEKTPAALDGPEMVTVPVALSVMYEATAALALMLAMLLGITSGVPLVPILPSPVLVALEVRLRVPA